MAAEPEHVFHIALARDWEAAQRVGEYRISTRGKALEDVGFIHGSFRHQGERTGSFLYDGVSDPVMVLEVDPERLPFPIRVENIEGGSEPLPHMYGPLPTKAVVATFRVLIEHGRFRVEWPLGR